VKRGHSHDSEFWSQNFRPVLRSRHSHFFPPMLSTCVQTPPTYELRPIFEFRFYPSSPNHTSSMVSRRPSLLSPSIERETRFSLPPSCGPNLRYLFLFLVFFLPFYLWPAWTSLRYSLTFPDTIILRSFFLRDPYLPCAPSFKIWFVPRIAPLLTVESPPLPCAASVNLKESSG